MTTDYSTLATIDYGSVIGREHFMDMAIRPLWTGMPNVAGPAYTVQLAPGDNLMLHAAIYEAPAGSVIVVDGVNTDFAVAGGNVCAVAKSRGIKGFVIDGVIRDLDDITEIQFPVFCKGTFPVPGGKNVFNELAQPVQCGGITVSTGDIIIADNEGVAVLPNSEAESIYHKAKNKADQEAAMTLEHWQTSHQEKITAALKNAAFMKDKES